MNASPYGYDQLYANAPTAINTTRVAKIQCFAVHSCMIIVERPLTTIGRMRLPAARFAVEFKSARRRQIFREPTTLLRSRGRPGLTNCDMSPGPAS